MLCTVFGFCSPKINFIANCFVRHKMPFNRRQVPILISHFSFPFSFSSFSCFYGSLALALAVVQLGSEAGRHIKEQFGCHSLQLVRHLYFAIQNYVGIHWVPPFLFCLPLTMSPHWQRGLSNLWQVMSAGSINKTASHHHHHQHLWAYENDLLLNCDKLQEGGKGNCVWGSR